MNLYKILPAGLAAASTGSVTATEMAGIVSIRGSVTVYRQPPPYEKLDFKVITDLSEYYPADQVNLQIVAYNATNNKPYTKDVYLNYAVID